MKRGAAAALLAAALAAGCGGGSDPEPEDGGAAFSASAPSPAPKADPLDGFRERVYDKVERKTREIATEVRMDGEVLRIQWAVDESINAGYTRKEARNDTYELLQVLKAHPPGPYARVEFVPHYTLVNDLGQEREAVVARVVYSRVRVNEIVYENVDVDDMWRLADGKVYVHPAFA